jgi:hypothetical protein
MSRLYRTLLGIQSGPPPGTKEITFNVKEWVLDPDNDFTDTEIAALHYMTVKIDGVEQLTNATGQTIFNLIPGTYTYEVYDMNRYLTTRKGTVTVTDAAISVDVKIYACLYTPAQINTMISTESYIPVASATELDGLRNATGRRMGQGTIFDTVSDVTTGVDKKYVQVRNIDLSAYADWIGIGLTQDPGRFVGFYNANDLIIDKLTIEKPISSSSNIGLFSALGIGAIVENINLTNVSITNTATGNMYQGALVGILGNATVRNIFIHGSIISNAPYVGGAVGINSSSGLVENVRCEMTINGDKCVGGVVGLNRQGGRVNKSSFSGMIDGVVDIGGIVGRNDNEGAAAAIVEECVADAVITSTGGASTADGLVVTSRSGGLVGTNRGSIIRYSSSSGTVTATGTGNNGRHTGGLVGTNFNPGAVVQNCWSDCTVSGESGTGGLVGRNASTISNSYSTGAVTGTTSIGGLVGDNTSGTITNSYYDYQTSGQSDTGKGLSRTTAQMQAGTASSFINPDGTIDATQNAANAMFTGWDNDIWDFQDNTKYPILK